jgi:hypothetical protein
MRKSPNRVEHLVLSLVPVHILFPQQNPSDHKMNRFFIVAALSALLVGTNAFAPASTSRRVTTTSLQFGIPTFQPKKDDESEKDPNLEDEKKIDLKGLVQLVTAGLGAPFLGDFQGVEKETGKLMFSLEANNLVDEKGDSKQTSMPYFENGWVDEEDEGFKFPWQK